MFTVVIYLNSDFQGGGTRFLDEVSQSEYTWNCMCLVQGNDMSALSQNGVGAAFLPVSFTEEVCFVRPKEGTALVFNHDTLHEGLPVTDGVKYILRTEVMYRRVDREMILNPLKYRKSENYLTTLALYQKSWQLEQGMST